MSEEKVFRKMFGPKKKEGEGSDLFRIFHNKEYRESYRSPDVVKTVKCDLNMLYMQVEWWGHAYRILERKPLFKYPPDI